jgi:fatty acid synthase
MLERFTKIIGAVPKERSNRWVSTSVLEDEWQTARVCSAEYHANNTVSPVYFYEALRKVHPYFAL